jgi:hypothetical protein
MKAPYLDAFQRQLIYANTYTGALLNLELAKKKFQRELDKTWLQKFIRKLV